MEEVRKHPKDNARITLADVARSAGLSVTTISDILLRGADVRYNAKTCKRVRKLAEEMGYTPSRVAQQLASGRSGEIGLLLTRSLNNPYWVRALAGIEMELRQKSYRLELKIVDAFDPSVAGHLQQLINGQVEALIVGPVYDEASLSLIRKELPAGFPVCMFGANLSDFDTVAVDEASSARLATQHLIDMGHRRINYLCAPDSDFSKIREVKAVLSNTNLEYDPEWLFTHADNGRFEEILSICAGFAQKWLETPAEIRPTAMICHSDSVALTAISACHQKGIRVPEDISLMGCDNLPESPYLVPALTSMDCRVDEQMAAVVDLIAARIKNPGRKREVRIFSPELIIRESVQRLEVCAGTPSGKS